MTIDEAIKHCEEVAEEQDKLCKRYDDASGYSRSHNEAIRTTDAKRCEECAAEHRQLAEWLKELKAYRGILANADRIIASEYGCVIIEGYKDVLDQMNEVFREVNADGDSR